MDCLELFYTGQQNTENADIGLYQWYKTAHVQPPNTAVHVKSFCSSSSYYYYHHHHNLYIYIYIIIHLLLVNIYDKHIP